MEHITFLLMKTSKQLENYVFSIKINNIMTKTLDQIIIEVNKANENLNLLS